MNVWQRICVGALASVIVFAALSGIFLLVFAASVFIAWSLEPLTVLLQGPTLIVCRIMALVSLLTGVGAAIVMREEDMERGK